MSHDHEQRGRRRTGLVASASSPRAPGKRTLTERLGHARAAAPTAREERLVTILHKGDAMSEAEAGEARRLLFTFEGDRFRRILARAVESKEFEALLERLGVAEACAMSREPEKQVVIP